MKNKALISATIDKTTKEAVEELAKKQKRSLSQMIDLLLQLALTK